MPTKFIINNFDEMNKNPKDSTKKLEREYSNKLTYDNTYYR